MTNKAWLGQLFIASLNVDEREGHVACTRHHSQTQGKIERWRRTPKNRVLQENYFLPGDLETQTGKLIDNYKPLAPPRKPEKPRASRLLLRAWLIIIGETGKDQTEDDKCLPHMKSAA